MTGERKEPSLSGLGSTRDEPAATAPSNTSSTTGNRSGTSSSREPSSRETRSKEEREPSHSRRQPPAPAPRPAARSPLVPFALILALTGLGLAGFSYWQLVKVQHQASSAEKRLVELEQRLALSDDESTQSVSTLQANLRETRQQLDSANGEIRKLWDARNTNRTAIGEHTTQIAAAAKAAQSASSAAAEAKKLAQAQDANIKALSNSVALQTEQAGVLNDSVNAQKKQVREAVDKANAVDAQLKQLQNDLARRVKRTEDAIEAIDASRVSVNREILELKRQISTGG
jgi:uncharacterized coiled-coil protein SlyX